MNTYYDSFMTKYLRLSDTFLGQVTDFQNRIVLEPNCPLQTLISHKLLVFSTENFNHAVIDDFNKRQKTASQTQRKYSTETICRKQNKNK